MSVVDLKDYFAQGATNDIESVFLISKSNCAFVNYKTDEACADALTRFHDSRFQGVRLVCRLRRGSTTPGSNNSPADLGLGLTAPAEGDDEAKAISGDTGENETAEGMSPTKLTRPSTLRSTDRYFIVKSLTIEDLEQSRQSGIWATQTHNEANLNNAYEVSILDIVVVYT